MSLDRRLRDGLERLADEIEPDVEGRLRTTLERGHRPKFVAFAMPLAASAAAILLVIVVAPALIAVLRGELGAPLGATPAPSPATPPLSGAYTTTVVPDDPAVAQHRLDGAWTVEFEADGLLSVTAPAGFTGTRTGYSYEVTGDELVTDLFGSDVCSTMLPGRYRWELAGETLTLTAVDEPCAGRAALLAGQPWQATTE